MRIHLQHHPRIRLKSTAVVTAGAGCSLGVCNGCQLMALLGWVPGGAPGELADARQPRFVHNTSGRFESRWVTVRVEDSPSILLKVLARCSFKVDEDVESMGLFCGCHCCIPWVLAVVWQLALAQ